MSAVVSTRMRRHLTELYNMRFTRFLAVGVLNSAFGYGCFYLLLKVGLAYPLALFCATVAGVLFNFKTTGVLVFNSGNNRLIVRFVLVYAVLYGINLLFIRLLTGLHLGVSLAAALALPPMAILAFLLNRSLVFQND